MGSPNHVPLPSYLSFRLTPIDLEAKIKLLAFVKKIAKLKIRYFQIFNSPTTAPKTCHVLAHSDGRCHPSSKVELQKPSIDPIGTYSQ